MERPLPSAGVAAQAAAASSSARRERRLEDVLRALPEREIAALIERVGIRIDTQKRIDVPAQVARALVRLPDVREPSRLPESSGELLRRITEAGGSLVVASLPPGIEALVRRGIVYARMAEEGIELLLPTAFVVQLRSWEGEDPRCLRVLLAAAPFETASAVASYYLGRPSTPPIALSLEPAWEVLGDRDALRAEVERCSLAERRLLDAIEQVGGEVDTQELMDLEREPMRVRGGAYGVAAGRRGAAFSLEKRGLLFPVHPNRYVIPSEVAVLIGAERSEQRARRREEIRSHVVAEDHLPRRARFSPDPGQIAVAFALAVAEWQREGGLELRAGVGTPRSLVARLGQRFGRSFEASALLAGVSRAVGLWESTVTAAAPPGVLTVAELGRALFDTWRRGGAWDEARSEAEMLRVAPEQRDPSPVGVLREMVLEALVDLGEGQWVPYQALADYLRDDPRAGGLSRLFARWATRLSVPAPQQLEVARRILLESLPALGVVDLGGATPLFGSAPDGAEREATGSSAGVALRLTPRGREHIAGEPLGRSSASELGDGRSLRVGTGARVAHVLELGAFADVAAIDPALELSLSSAALARGLAAGVEAAEMRRRIERLCPLDAELTTVLEQAGTVVGRATLAPASGFLWVDDADVRELLRNGSPVADLFVDPSPLGGLLIAPGVDAERLARRCRAIGVEVTIEPGALRARTSSMPPPPRSDTRGRTSSWRPPSLSEGSRAEGSARAAGGKRKSGG